MPASQLNGWLKIIASALVALFIAVASFSLGAARDWGAFTTALEAHEESKGHPRLVEEVDALKAAVIRAEERQRYIEAALERIETSLGSRP